MEKAWFCERFLFEVVMVKEKKIQCETCSVNKVSFIHYIKLTRVMPQVIFKEFELVYGFFSYFFLFSIILNR